MSTPGWIVKLYRDQAQQAATCHARHLPSLGLNLGPLHGAPAACTSPAHLLRSSRLRLALHRTVMSAGLAFLNSLDLPPRAISGLVARYGEHAEDVLRQDAWAALLELPACSYG